MKNFLLTVYLVLLTSLAFCQTVKKVKITEVEDYIKNSDHPLVVNFWATWCTPCVEELPFFIETIKRYSEQKVELVMVSLDLPSSYPNKIADVIKRRNFSGTFFWLNETNADYFCPKVDAKWDGAIPSTLLVNSKTGYRKFFGRPLTDRQIELEVGRLTGLKQ